MSYTQQSINIYTPEHGRHYVNRLGQGVSQTPWFGLKCKLLVFPNNFECGKCRFLWRNKFATFFKEWAV